MQVISVLFYLLCAALLVAIPAACASAIFLIGLESVGTLRESIPYWYLGLPPAGLLIGYTYHKMSAEVIGGSSTVIEKARSGKGNIPLIMMPLILGTTWLTHLVGGSAGREGTAIQMSSAMADIWQRYFQHPAFDNRLWIQMGISAGFASVFGTPWAGALFAWEVSKQAWNLNPFAKDFSITAYIRPAAILSAAILANAIVDIWPVQHTHYPIDEVNIVNLYTIFSVIIAAFAFGLAARLFILWHTAVQQFMNRIMPYPMFRPLLGGVVLMCIFMIPATHTFAGLGIPQIVNAFEGISAPHEWISKLMLTGLTLGTGFKGGEVTPLFCIGATLGSAASAILPISHALLAAAGFTAVFAGATRTAFASSIMGLELFGIAAFPWILLACLISVRVAGKKSIYTHA
jgi:H+/Cl- antiporter ClcA